MADQLRPKVPKLAALIDEAEPDVLAYTGFPAQHRIAGHAPSRRILPNRRRVSMAYPPACAFSAKIIDKSRIMSKLPRKDGASASSHRKNCAQRAGGDSMRIPIERAIERVPGGIREVPLPAGALFSVRAGARIDIRA